MTYELRIYSSQGKENFRAIFYQQADGKFYYRVKFDRFDYEEMIKQFLSRGSVKVRPEGNDYHIERHTFDSIHDIKIYLEQNGFNVELVEIAEDFASVSVVVDGEDLNPEVISIKESEKILNFTNLLFQYANNVDYSPKYKERASSFAIDIQEQDINIQKIDDFFHQLLTNSINREVYFNDGKYRALIHALQELLSIKTLRTFSILYQQHEMENKEIHIDTIRNSLKRLNTLIKERPFQIPFKKDELRAFDDKKFRVFLDKGKRFSLHMKEEVYHRLKSVPNGATILPQESYYISTQTIMLNNFIIQ